MIDIISQHSNTLPSGFKVTFTVGRISKAGSPSRGAATSQSSAGIESGPAHQFPQSETTRGESDAKSAHAFSHLNLIYRRRHRTLAEQQPQQETISDQAPRESAAVEISRPISHSSELSSQALTDQTHGVSPSAPCGSLSSGAA